MACESTTNSNFIVQNSITGTQLYPFIYVLFISLHVTVTRLSSCNRDYTIYEAEYIYYLAFFTKNVLTPHKIALNF